MYGNNNLNPGTLEAFLCLQPIGRSFGCEEIALPLTNLKLFYTYIFEDRYKDKGLINRYYSRRRYITT